MTAKEKLRENQEKLFDKIEKERNALWQAKEKQNSEMQIALTKLANNYSEFIGKMNTLIDRCEPLIEASIKMAGEGGA